MPKEFTPVSGQKDSYLCHTKRVHTCVILKGFIPVSGQKGSHLCHAKRIHTCVMPKGFTPVSGQKDSYLCHAKKVHTCFMPKGTTHVSCWKDPYMCYIRRKWLIDFVEDRNREFCCRLLVCVTCPARSVTWIVMGVGRDGWWWWCGGGGGIVLGRFSVLVTWLASGKLPPLNSLPLSPESSLHYSPYPHSYGFTKCILWLMYDYPWCIWDTNGMSIIDWS